MAWCWELREDRVIVVVNLSGGAAQGRIHLPWGDLQESAWRLHDCLSDAVYDYDGVEMSEQGLYVSLEPWEHHLFRCSRAVAPAEAHAYLMSLARG